MRFVDMHCDTLTALLALRDAGEKDTLRENRLHMDLQKMKQGDYLLQNFAVFSDLKFGNAPAYSKRVIALFHQEMRDHADWIRPVRCFRDIEENRKRGLMSAMLTLEEGAATGEDLENLSWYYDQGVRMITLTWNYPNGIGYPNVDASQPLDEDKALFSVNTKDGLTPFGFSYVEAMEALGMIVDVSHLSDKGFYDVLRVTKRPFVASHSNARAICPVGRNMTDDMMRKLADRGGVLGLNYCTDFINFDRDTTMLEDMMIHIKYIKNVAGIDALGLGSDFDGIDPTLELQDCSRMPLLLERMKQHGLTEAEIDKITRDNVLRVYRDCLS